MKISVVIPATERSKSLVKAINSVYSQTGDFEIEVLVVFNNFIEPLEKAPPLDRVFVQNNKFQIEELYIPGNTNVNANTARNFGTRHASGKYVAYLDSDDEWHTEHLEARLNVLQEKNSIAVFGPFLIDRGNGVKQRKFVPYTPRLNPYIFLWERAGLAQTSGFLLDKELVVANPWDENLKRSQDHDFFIRICKVCDWEQVNAETYEVVWKRFVHRSYDFDSYWQFYSDKKIEFTDRAACGYLFSRLLESSFSNDGYFETFKSEIKTRGNHLSVHKRAIALHSVFARLAWYLNQLIN